MNLDIANVPKILAAYLDQTLTFGVFTYSKLFLWSDILLAVKTMHPNQIFRMCYPLIPIRIAQAEQSARTHISRVR